PALLVRVVDPFGEQASEVATERQESLIQFEVVGLPSVGDVGGGTGGIGGSGGSGGGGSGAAGPTPRATPRPSVNHAPIVSAGATLTVPPLGTVTLSASV